MWVLYAILAAVTAAFVTIFSKLGLKKIDPVIATTVRSMIMTAFLLVAAGLYIKIKNVSLTLFNTKEWILLILAGLAGASSWLFYFMALNTGKASAVAAIDRTSIVFIVFLSALFLSEKLCWQSVTGVILVVSGAFLISMK